ncbi:unnamed protein product [Paramecium pentaurelia]|uniref:Uncharacterized protein n=1 Tax=Paramecium pentaurelia TaxID=43138 RepID=A0A8S1WG57_9CILI|nr:unnamed protein product [Paramecium pentaurelia]
MEMAQRLDINSLVHLNNFIFLVFSICADKIVTEDFQCNDPEGIGFLHFILYGNLIVYGIIFIIQFLSACNLLDTCTRKFGAVCITINTFVFFGGVIIFDVISMLYGIKQHFFTAKSKCREIELFTMCCAYIFVVWISVMIIGAINHIIDYFKPRNDLIQPLNKNPAVL